MSDSDKISLLSSTEISQFTTAGNMPGSCPYKTDSLIATFPLKYAAEHMSDISALHYLTFFQAQISLPDSR
jgi:hypothetical protein